jgi:hypothetical protein
MTQSHDRLIGENAAKQMRDGVLDATEVVIQKTGQTVLQNGRRVTIA